MGIRLVYGLKTHDTGYLREFFPARRLAEAAASLRIDFDVMLCPPGAESAPIVDACRRHVALLRGELPHELYESLESEGILVVNSARSTALATDKFASASLFESLGCSRPATVGFRLGAGKSCAIPMEPPFVAKPRFGKMGHGVALVSTEAGWNEYLSALAVGDGTSGPHGIIPDSGPTHIAQEYIRSSHGRDVRFFFAAWPGEASVCVARHGPGFLSNAHAGGSMERFEPSAALRAEAERLFAASGLDYGTVDFLFADDTGTAFKICELNACPGFEEFERLTGLDAARAIIARALARTERT